MNRVQPLARQTLTLEICIVLGVVLLVLAVILPEFKNIIAKVRLVEIFYLTGTARTELMEQMALTGDGISDQALPSRLAVAPRLENIEDYLGQKQTLSTAAKSQGDEFVQQNSSKDKNKTKEQTDKERAERLGKLDVQRNNYSLHVSGIIGAEQRPFYITFNPSVNAGAPTANIIWLCGAKSPLPGWTPPLERAGTDLPRSFISFICR